MCPITTTKTSLRGELNSFLARSTQSPIFLFSFSTFLFFLFQATLLFHSLSSFLLIPSLFFSSLHFFSLNNILSFCFTFLICPFLSFQSFFFSPIYLFYNFFSLFSSSTSLSYSIYFFISPSFFSPIYQISFSSTFFLFFPLSSSFSHSFVSSALFLLSFLILEITFLPFSFFSSSSSTV